MQDSWNALLAKHVQASAPVNQSCTNCIASRPTCPSHGFQILTGSPLPPPTPARQPPAAIAAAGLKLDVCTITISHKDVLPTALSSDAL
eukprot:718557-Pelagomonas_calceolata.AAC.7